MTQNDERRPLQTDGVLNLILSALAWPFLPGEAMRDKHIQKKARRDLDRLLGVDPYPSPEGQQLSANAAYYHLKALGLLDREGYQVRVLRGEAA